MPSRRQVHAPMADNGSPEVMGRQAHDRLPNRVIHYPHRKVARAAAIAPSLRLLGLGLPPGISPTAPAIAQSCQESMGQAITRAPAQLDACSFNRVSLNSVNFTYYLGSQKINAQAHCQNRTRPTFHDQVTHRPQSTATANMLARVCNSGELAVVFDPPSNMRVSPNGAILCTVQSRVSIKIYGNQGEWHYTDFCGSMGMIHTSPIHF